MANHWFVCSVFNESAAGVPLSFRDGHDLERIAFPAGEGVAGTDVEEKK
jgi:hypothetical protein